MKSSLLTSLAEVHGRVARARRILLFTDYDGTLAPIVNRPAEAQLPTQTRKVLTALSRRERINVIILSGRSLRDLQAHIGIPALIYAGNHGLEISGPDFYFTEPVAEEAREQLRGITEKLSRKLSQVRGVLVEDKGLTTSVHFRMVGDSEVDQVVRAVDEAIGEATGFVLTAGKMVREIRPIVDWNKGAAALWIAGQLGAEEYLPLCLGDDQTDEDTFAAFPNGVRVRVGDDANTLAEYHVENTEQMHSFLAWLADTVEALE